MAIFDGNYFSYTRIIRLESTFAVQQSALFCNVSCGSYTVVPVLSGLCDQGTPAVSGQYNDVRGDFQYKLTRDQGTPANADRHLFVILPLNRGTVLYLFYFSSHWVANVIKYLC